MQPLPSARKGFIGFSSSVLQRSIVIVRFVLNRGGSHWRGHGRYLAREGAQQEGMPGLGFDTSAQEIDIADRLSLWQRAGDPRFWKVIVSPELGERFDLRQHARELVATMEGDLGLHLEWVGIAHFDTAYPHLHLILRGRSQDGIEFRMPRDYLSHGIRHRSQEIATQAVGFRFARDLAAARERTFEASKYGELDETLEHRADPDRRIEFKSAVSSSDAMLRAQLLRRLSFLSNLGLARRVGKGIFELSEQHRVALEHFQLLRDLGRYLKRYGELLVDPHAPQRFTELMPGTEIHGRVVGGTEDELGGGRTYLILDGIDGTVHFVPQTPEIEKHRNRDELLRGEIITFRGAHASPRSEGIIRVEVTRHGRLPELEAHPEPATLIDLVAVQTTHEQRTALPTEGPHTGFRAQLRAAVARRLPLLEERGLLQVLQEEQEGHGDERVRRLAPVPGAEERIKQAMRQRDGGLTPLSEVERIYGKPVVHAKLETGRAYVGRAVAMASDGEGRAYVVLQTGPALTALPVVEPTHLVDQEVHARAVTQEMPGERRWTLAWQFDAREREGMRDRGRER